MIFSDHFETAPCLFLMNRDLPWLQIPVFLFHFDEFQIAQEVDAHLDLLVSQGLLSRVLARFHFPIT